MRPTLGRVPIYDYRCNACGHVEEIMQPAAAPAPARCATCDRRGTLRRAIGAAPADAPRAPPRPHENQINRSLARDAPFVVDGRERGHHRTERLLARDRYRVVAQLDAPLPQLF